MNIKFKAFIDDEQVIEVFSIGGLLLLILLLYFMSLKNFNLFCNASELINITCGVSIYAVSKNTYKFSKSGYFLFLGISFLFISSFNLFHISYYGVSMGGNFRVSNLLEQKDTVSSFLQAAAVIYSFRYVKKPLNPMTTFLAYLLMAILIFFGVFYFNAVPTCYGSYGPTIFKKVVEAINIVLLASSGIFLKFNKREFNRETMLFLILSIISMVISQAFLISSIKKPGFMYTIGHLMKVVSIMLIYKAVIQSNLTNPYKSMFSKLKEAKEKLEYKTNELVEINEKLNKENEEFKIMQQDLKESKKNYLQLIDFLPYAIITHRNGKILFLNNAALTMFKANDYKDMIGREILDFVHSEERKVSKTRITKTYNGMDTELLERRMIDINGEVLYVETKAVPYVHKGLPAALVVIGDVSERRRAEEKDKMLKEAIEYDRIKTEFFANISHELRTPLNVIFGAVQLVELYAENDAMVDNIDKVKGYITNMKQNSYRMLRLINNLIDMTKIDSGYLKINKQNHNIISIIEDITLSVAQYIESKGLNIIFDTDVEEKIVACDADVIERVMLNLLSNAIKFTSEGGQIFVNIEDRGGYIDIFVKDTGIGITEDKLAIIFERFRQVDKSLARNNEGSGIGLSLVKSLVEIHGGQINVSSEYGKGTEFVISLPAYNLAEDEVAADYDLPQGNVERINIEFSDIYS
ncbi:MASE3 domain-containing sensor histidine kinase [Clostridium omnivorum]|uniref:histidine kinase n=1 Tax=Clostridium omnivorum TaxID=1604902 RepID=A0ABQ5N6P2_9CLOT|nr:MASE3 domain-containing protein [Clostridium sp. E14]GLC30912.1 PAS domain-containing sensor histidine kinase [Clostridium sp. E14]